MVVDYEYYVESYGGLKIQYHSWKLYSNKAEARLKKYTFGRLQEPWPNEAKTAVCEIAECMCQYDKRYGKKSEEIDGYSVSYDTDKDIDLMLYEIARTYLANTGLMDVQVT